MNITSLDLPSNIIAVPNKTKKITPCIIPKPILNVIPNTIPSLIPKPTLLIVPVTIPIAPLSLPIETEVQKKLYSFHIDIHEKVSILN
ncbi:hypothetical protein KDK_13540 [Dictyobacter kobayashii]|uniref:Uncharacterized protein n=1 Tax=Dictyobacter kobayashii TaxID=2014872 RepID=A0A402AEP4_9CHLR|nr:hypothetical protein KDK_13540 [Dictyobacter kobayashii]